jgi:hypothetical protein
MIEMMAVGVIGLGDDDGARWLMVDGWLVERHTDGANESCPSNLLVEVAHVMPTCAVHFSTELRRRT